MREPCLTDAADEPLPQLQADFRDFAIFECWDALRGWVYIAIRVRGRGCATVIMTEGEANLRALLAVKSAAELREMSAASAAGLGAPA